MRTEQEELEVSIPESLLENVQLDVKIYEDQLQVIAEAVVIQEISKFPIFIAHRETSIPFGKPIIVSEQMNTQWSINASLLEEFVSKKIILPRQVAHFRSVYKDPKQYLCLFVISGKADAGFAFYPYSIKKV